MTQTTTAVQPEVLHDVQGVLAAAIERMSAVGWRRQAPGRGRPGGDRLVDALNYASAHAGVDRPAHLLVFACAAMAIELHTGAPAHALLPDPLADAYLNPMTGDDRLHLLDASIVVRYNAEVCTGAADATALLRIAYDQAPNVIAAQDAYARLVILCA